MNNNVTGIISQPVSGATPRVLRTLLSVDSDQPIETWSLDVRVKHSELGID